MNSRLTEPGVPEYLISRWSFIEREVQGEIEDYLLSVIRHVALGCSTCRQEEVVERLTRLPNPITTMLEGLHVVDVLMLQYLHSEKGAEEMKLLRQGLTPVLFHGDKGPNTDDGFSETKS